MKPWILCASLISSAAAYGQQPAEKPAFEVASIKPSDPSPVGQVRVRMGTDAGILRYNNVSLKDCIRVAYGVKDFQVEGPDWIANTRFDIMAKLPAGSAQDQIPEMLQTLLADRFKLALHRQTKVHAIYALVVAKGGPRLKAAEVPTDEAPATAGSPGRGGQAQGMMTTRVGPDGVHLKAASQTLAFLGEMVSRFTDRPIVDMTGIRGQYHFDLVFSPETMRNMPGPAMSRGPGPAGGGDRKPGADAPAGGGESRPGAEVPADAGGTIYDAVQRYGLKLEPRKAPMEILLVDQMEKTPTEN
jgi:uncharacterized protein (TIGR03435 family)